MGTNQLPTLDPPAELTGGPAKSTSWRPDIQGLRAIAVGLVVLFHAGVPWLVGGYVGVDVFYVISGFLIIGLLADQVTRSGTVRLADFWLRRIRRLLPASLLVLSVTLLAARLFDPPLLMKTVAPDVAWAAGYASNIRFAALGTDYLAGNSPSPVLHYWSLACEEQFYLLAPLLLWAIARWSTRPRRALATCLALGGALSFVLSVLLSAREQPYAFFLLPTRAWELALGGLVALWLRRASRRPRPALVATFSIAGVVAILVAGLTYDAVTTLYPSWRAALPTLGAAALLYAGAGNGGAVQRLLALRPMRFIGDISYSLYLWHWPVLIVPMLAAGHALPPIERAALVGVSVLLAAASYRFIENPARHWNWAISHRVATFGAAACATLLVIGGASAATALPPLHSERSAVATAGGVVSTLPVDQFVGQNARPSLETAQVDYSQTLRDGCLITYHPAQPKLCSFGPASAPTVVLFGDSHAEMWAPPLEELARQGRIHLVAITKTACPPADTSIWLLEQPYAPCDLWRTAALAQIAQMSPALVVVSQFTHTAVVNPQDGMIPGASRTTAELSRRHIPVLWLGDSPRFDAEVPICLSAHLSDPGSCNIARSRGIDASQQSAERGAVSAAGGTWSSVADWLCAGPTCPAMAGNYVLYRDNHHVTATFARTLTAEFWHTMVLASPRLGSN